ncbi:MAG: gliding motility lipoprotein GldD [Flavobacteriaceae bacterium]|nr:gliding motility lipoprotein GldD [Flavobacteriaceae bacterium]
MRNLCIIFGIFLVVSCTKETLPKPKAYLSLKYQKTGYIKLPLERPYTFEVLENSLLKDEPKNWLKIQYPRLKASVDITYRSVNDNLRELLIESEWLVVKHTVKAEQITSENYINAERKVYGTLNEITGNAASQIQFHITDSVHHFIKGALYFKAKPNYDSILPAVDFIKKDILHLMETLQWKQ